MRIPGQGLCRQPQLSWSLERLTVLEHWAQGSHQDVEKERESCQLRIRVPRWSPWLQSSWHGPELVPSQNKLETPVSWANSLIWHPRPLSGLRELIREHREETVPFWDQWARRAGGWGKKPPTQRLKSQLWAGGRILEQVLELRVLLHGLCTFNKS